MKLGRDGIKAIAGAVSTMLGLALLALVAVLGWVGAQYVARLL